MTENPEWSKMSEEEKRKAREQTNKILDANTKKVQIQVGIDKGALTQLAEDKVKAEKSKEELAVENEDLRSKLEIISEKEIERRMSELKMNDSEKAFFREHPEAIKGYEKGKDAQGQGGQPNARPDSPQQVGSVSRQQGYETPEEMIADLRRRAKEGEAEGKIIMDELMRKYVRGMRDSGNFQIKYPNVPEPTESKGETITKVIGQGSGEDPTQESELERLGVKRNKGSPLRRSE